MYHRSRRDNPVIFIRPLLESPTLPLCQALRTSSRALSRKNSSSDQLRSSEFPKKALPPTHRLPDIVFGLSTTTDPPPSLPFTTIYPLSTHLPLCFTFTRFPAILDHPCTLRQRRIYLAHPTYSYRGTWPVQSAIDPSTVPFASSASHSDTLPTFTKGQRYLF